MLSPEELKKMEAIEAVESGESVEEVKEQTPTYGDNESFLKGRIAEVLGHEGQAGKYDYELTELLNYAKSKGAESLEDAMWEIRHLANRLGTPGYGENRIKFMYRYVYLLKESLNLESKLKKMEVLNG